MTKLFGGPQQLPERKAGLRPKLEGWDLRCVHEALSPRDMQQPGGQETVKRGLVTPDQSCLLEVAAARVEALETRGAGRSPFRRWVFSVHCLKTSLM